MSTGPWVLVTDADQRPAIAAVRSLGRAGYRVRAAERAGPARPAGFASRHAAECARMGALEADSLREAARGCDAVFPVSTNAVLAAIQAGPSLGAAALLPSLAAFEAANDKARLMVVAREAGVRCPRGRRVAGPAEVEALGAEWGWPVVFKLATDRGLYLEPAARYRIAADAREAGEALAALAAAGTGVLAQEYVPGEALGASFVYDREGRPRAAFCHRRVREYPIQGGPSTLCESVRDEVLEAQGRRVLDALGWVGPAMVEFKRSREDGTLHLLEVNPRPWGTIALAVACGVDVPRLAVELALGLTPGPSGRYPAGVRMRFLATDLLSACAHVRAGHWREAARFLADLADPRVRAGVFRRDDPGPALRYLAGRLRWLGGSP
ncbi:MAG: ATP-grasp domain-containing protein [Planctomycetes bacterium]|nr:ATP-grasp domain-containing protein [Planctomycetota bacterium]